MKTPIFTILALTAKLSAATVISSSLSSTSDITLYEDTSGALSTVASSAATDPYLSGTTLQGTASAAGGNIELGDSTDTYTDMSFGGLFQNAATTSLSTTHSSGEIVTVRSLNGDDWFITSSGSYDTSYGAANLANIYFEDLRTAALSSTTDSLVAFALTIAPSDFYDEFLTSGGFAQLSDPNISYINVDNGIAEIGLAGFYDNSERIASLTGQSIDDVNAAFPNGFQSSEVVMVNGEALYSFSAVSSGVSLDDGFDSYDATYALTTSVPEPSTSILGALAFGILITNRRRA